MEFEVSIRIKVDDSAFYWDANTLDRNEEVVELLRNAMYDLDEVTIKSLEVEHIK
tara:strand:+ start:533 stop:697 length:165 start_codon:yes stop_codon:yes gene_type:complete